MRGSTKQTNKIEIYVQTLDLRIGVRIPASQPFIRKDFLKTVRFTPSSLLWLCCDLLPTGWPIELVHERHVSPWNQMPVDVHGNLNRAVPYLFSHIGERGPGLNQCPE